MFAFINDGNGGIDSGIDANLSRVGWSGYRVSDNGFDSVASQSGVPLMALPFIMQLWWEKCTPKYRRTFTAYVPIGTEPGAWVQPAGTNEPAFVDGANSVGFV